jgi:hypothetical protein
VQGELTELVHALSKQPYLLWALLLLSNLYITKPESKLGHQIGPHHYLFQTVRLSTVCIERAFGEPPQFLLLYHKTTFQTLRSLARAARLLPYRCCPFSRSPLHPTPPPPRTSAPARCQRRYAPPNRRLSWRGLRKHRITDSPTWFDLNRFCRLQRCRGGECVWPRREERAQRKAGSIDPAAAA